MKLEKWRIRMFLCSRCNKIEYPDNCFHHIQFSDPDFGKTFCYECNQKRSLEKKWAIQQSKQENNQ